MTARADAVLATWGPTPGPALVTVLDGTGALPSSSPRPFLHPVRTLRGVDLTASRPEDHEWHVGVGFAVPSVGGVNLWGGGSFRPDDGYQMRGDHGRQRVDAVDRTAAGVRLRTTWLGPDDEPLLTELRTHTWHVVDDVTWRLQLRTELLTRRTLELGSPGSAGRSGAGYGGWSWRFPAALDVRVTAPGPDGVELEGESAVHGLRSPWLCWAAEFRGAERGDATLLFRTIDPVGSTDPWFVRIADYPAVGTALAWSRPVVLRPGRPFRRAIEVVVADGRVDAATLAERVDGAARPSD